LATIQARDGPFQATLAVIGDDPHHMPPHPA